MPLQLSDDLFEHLIPPETVDWTLKRVHIPSDNPAEVVLQLKFAGTGSPFVAAMRNFSGKPIADRGEAMERALRQFVKHAVAGWRNVLDEGAPAAFLASVCLDLLVRILRKRGLQGIDQMNEMIGYAGSSDSFYAEPVEAGELGKE